MPSPPAWGVDARPVATLVTSRADLSVLAPLRFRRPRERDLLADWPRSAARLLDGGISTVVLVFPGVTTASPGAKSAALWDFAADMHLGLGEGIFKQYCMLLSGSSVS